MGILETLGLDKMEVGKTVPPVIKNKNDTKPKPADVDHIPRFEKLAVALSNVDQELEDLKNDFITFEREVAEGRRSFDAEKERLEFERSTLHDRINEHIEIVFPNARLVHEPPPTPDPDSLDVQVRPIQEGTPDEGLDV